MELVQVVVYIAVGRYGGGVAVSGSGSSRAQA